MSAWLPWVLAGIAICGAELLHPGVFLLWIGLAAIATGATTWGAGPGLAWQVGAFLMFLASSLCIPILRRRAGGGGVNAPDAGLLGQTCRALSFEGQEGRVMFRDGAWLARVSGVPPQPGAILRVVGLDGTTLLVTPDRPEAG